MIFGSKKITKKKQKTTVAAKTENDDDEDTICLYCNNENHTFLKSSEGWCFKSEESHLTKSKPELADASPNTSDYPDAEDPQKGISKNQSELYLSVNNIVS
ncbi:hypothetical protein WA026_008577 [Henosepilachna vigintioctopunctata]|uniref:Uncharacterized protein n=1 Tax=Henosepilachna vigintioctopunctata TaxID=420089 RepID=A0AAW1UFW8_9CUCU